MPDPPAGPQAESTGRPRIARTPAAGGIATVTLDDGKVNALDETWFTEFEAVLDTCADDAAIVVRGREGMFSAGLNTRALGDLDDAGLQRLLVAFGRATLRLWLEPRPVVAAVTGHAVAAGTTLALACDHVVAADGAYRWGLTESTVGFPLPTFVIALARGSLRSDRLDDLLLAGRTVAPGTAVEAGFADQVAPAATVEAVATAVAAELATLPRGVYAESKRRLRGAAAAAARADLTEDIRAVVAARAGASESA